MMNKTKKRMIPFANLLIMLTVFLSVVSCSKDEGYSLNDYWVGIGTIRTAGMQGGYYIEMDSGKKLFPSVKNFYYQPSEGQRAIVNYTILYDEKEFYDHLVRVNYISNILTKQTSYLTEANQDSIGNDKVEIEECWMHNNYLNIIFGYNGSGTNIKHNISLVRNTIVDHPDDGRVRLELRHNANNDAPIYGFQSIVSFDVSKAFPAGTQEGELIFLANTFSEGTKQFAIKVNLQTQKASVQSLSQHRLEEIALEIKRDKYQ